MKSRDNSLSSVFSSLIAPPETKFQLATTIAIVAAVPLWLLVREVRRRHGNKQPSLPYPPGPPARFLIGNIMDLPSITKGELMDEKLLEWSKEYGLVFSFSIPVSNKIIVVADPDLAKKVLVSRNYPKAPIYKTMGSTVMGKYSMVILEGKEWATLRRAFNPGFAPDFLKEMLSTMATKLERFLACVEEDIDASKPTNVLKRAQTFTSDVIVSVAFGEDWGGHDPHPARMWISEMINQIYKVMLNPARRLLDWQVMRNIKTWESLLAQEMQNILKRRLEKGSSSQSKDIISIAIDQMKSENGSLTEQDKEYIVHQMKTFYIAGHDSTASSLSWATWLLSKHKVVLDNVRAELQENGVWTDLASPPTYEQLQKCSYLEAVVKETLRLYPPASSLTRLTEDVTESYQGYALSGKMIMVSPFIIHHHPLLWKEPEKFRPQRFLDGSEDDIPSKFIPFSRGPRDCIGKNFAMLEVKLAVSALVARYDFECVDPNEEIFVQITLLPKNGGQVRFTHKRAHET